MPRMPALPHIPPLWRESRFGLELADLRRSPVFRGHGVPDGGGRAVMLIPGFLAGDGSLATMTHWLRANGYHTRRAGIRANVSCSEDACAQPVQACRDAVIVRFVGVLLQQLSHSEQ